MLDAFLCIERLANGHDQFASHLRQKVSFFVDDEKFNFLSQNLSHAGDREVGYDLDRIYLG